MDNNYLHYTPVLRFKKGEIDALSYFSQSTYRSFVTPLVEIMPENKEAKKKKTLAADFSNTIFCIWQNSHLMVDVWRLNKQEQTQFLGELRTAAANYAINIIPVITSKSEIELIGLAKKFADQNNNGICIRLFKDFFDSDNPTEKILMLISQLGNDLGEIDLIIDLQVTTVSAALLAEQYLGVIPNIEKWRTITLTSGAFPKDLSELKPGEHNIPRLDWNQWLQSLDNKGITRKMSFGDYATQYPDYSDPVIGSKVSASIRYTLSNSWLIMRGRAPGPEVPDWSAQWPAHSKMLIKKKEYMGKEFSYGDKFISDVTQTGVNEKTGGPKSWVTVAINHHLTFVAYQIANYHE